MSMSERVEEIEMVFEFLCTRSTIWYCDTVAQ